MVKKVPTCRLTACVTGFIPLLPDPRVKVEPTAKASSCARGPNLIPTEAVKAAKGRVSTGNCPVSPSLSSVVGRQR